MSLVSALTAWSAGARAGTATLETYGDSITAGFLSYTDVTAPPPLSGPDGLGSIVSDLANYLLNGQKEQLVKHHRPELAWPAVLGKRLADASGTPISLRNAAVSGAQVSDLTSQVRRARAVGPTGDALALFFIGHNDFCNNASTPQELADYFVAQYGKALAEWDVTHQGATAVLFPVGDIPRVFRTLKGYVWLDNGSKRFACEDSWERYFPYCPTYSRMQKAGTLDGHLGPRIRTVNLALQKLAERLDGGGTRNHFRFASQLELESLQLEPGYFAIDCYHLSPKGQTRLAEEVQSYLTHAL